MGAVKKLIKVYGATRAVAAGANKTNEKVKSLQDRLNSWGEILMEESTVDAIKAIAAQDIPTLIAKLEAAALAPAPPTIASPTVVRRSSIDETEDENVTEITGYDDLLDQGDDTGDHQQINPQLLCLVECADELIALIGGSHAHITRMTALEERMRTSGKESAALKRDLQSNTTVVTI